MVFHRNEVWECAIKNMSCTRDMFMMSDNVYNLCKERAPQLWQKYAQDSFSVRMWKEENEIAPLRTEEEVTFYICIQTP